MDGDSRSPLAFRELRTMLGRLLQRVVMAAVTLLGVAIIVFVLLRVVPGRSDRDDDLARGPRPADIAALRAHYGLDTGLPCAICRLGARSRAWRFRDVDLAASQRARVACRTLACDAGTRVRLAGLRDVARRGHRRIRDADERHRGRPVVDAVNGLFLAVPDFIWAFALVLLFGVFAPVLPLSGRIDPSLDEQFVTPFYLIESLVTLRFAALLDVIAPYDHADARARPAACRDHRARLEGVPARGDGAGLCPARAAEGHVANCGWCCRRRCGTRSRRPSR